MDRHFITHSIEMSHSSDNPGSSNSGGESSSSSLRPKRNTGHLGVRGSIIRGQSQVARGNPLDRLCERVLNWSILEDVSRDISPKSYDWLRDQTTTETVPVLPDVYTTYDTYVDAWEPLMIKEVQDSIISKFPTLIRSTVSGTFHCTVLPDRGHDPPTIQLECVFNHDQLNGDGLRRTAGTMDLLIISLSPFLMPNADRTSASTSHYAPASTQRVPTIDEFKAQKLILGLIVSNSHNGPRTSKVSVSKRQWDMFKQSCDERHVSTYKSVPKGNNSGARLSNNLVGKVKSYKLHYAVVDSLRSNWREFQALHDLGLNIPLMGEVLGGERSFDMASTPPHQPDSGDEGNPLTVSPRLEHQSSQDSAYSAGSVFSVGSMFSPATGNLTPAAPSTSFAGATAASTSSTNAGSSALAVPKKAHWQLNRLEIIEQVINSWRMKGCTEKFMQYLRLKYNPSQLHAIHCAVDQQGFTLVQGPPGTGKTSTILGILNAIHIREYNMYYKLALEALLGAEGQLCRVQPYEHPWLKLISRLTSSKPRILVVAPSNTAVDNVILRIMGSGFVDGNGGKYYPNILRVGVGSKSPKIRAVTLEELTEKELAKNNTSTNRRDAIDALSTNITEMIKKIAFLQSMLVNLTLAYNSVTLPDAFELRVDGGTGAPLWVDHHTRTTSTSPPDRKLLEKRGACRIYNKLETLPDYIIYSHQLTQLLGAIEHANAKRSKLHALDTMTTEMKAASVREMAERSLIDGAHILFTTLNGAGHPSMESTEFCVTVVDEAAQSIEPSVLIALRRGCRQCIMVGDQQQLPATVFSAHARAAQYDRSLFQRLIETGHPYIMLDTQYRMCREISAFPSRVFYKGQLKDGENVSAPGYLPPYLMSTQPQGASSSAGVRGTSPPPFAPFMFLDLHSSQESLGPSGSQSNNNEAQLCMSLIQTLLQVGRECRCESLGTVGVITFYADQLQLLRRIMSKHDFPIRTANALPPAPGVCSLEDLELNTVDGFQGKETDIIIISAVRANDKGLVGFIGDLRRLNVGLTRARKALLVVGHAPTLRNNVLWRELIDYAHEMNTVVSVPHTQTNLLDLLRYRTAPQNSFANALNRYQHGAPKASHYTNPLPPPVPQRLPPPQPPGIPDRPIHETPQRASDQVQVRKRQCKDRDYSGQGNRAAGTTSHSTTSGTTVHTDARIMIETSPPAINNTAGVTGKKQPVCNGGSTSRAVAEVGPATLVPIGSNIVVNKEVVGWVNSNPYVPAPPAPVAPPPMPQIFPERIELVQGGAFMPQASQPPPRAFRPPPPLMPPSRAPTPSSISGEQVSSNVPSHLANTSGSVRHENKRKIAHVVDVEEGEVVDLISE